MINSILRHAVVMALLASAGSSLAATFAWQLGDAQPAKRHSIAGVRAAQIIVDPALPADQAESLTFRLFDRNVTAQRTGFERLADGWTWSGQVDNQPGHFVVFTSINGNVAGLVSTPEGNFEVRPDRAGSAYLIELDSDAFPACAGAIEPTLSLLAPEFPADVASIATDAPLAPAGAATVTIDVMVFYTNTLLSTLGGEAQVRAQAQAAVAASNTSFANSQMTARFNLVATLLSPIEESAVGSNITSAQLATLRDNAAVQTLRNQYGADLVSLMVNDGSTGCGIGYVMRSPGAGFASSGYQVTASGCAVGNLSYVHEHGHNMGMEHDPPNGTTPASASYPWSFGHTISGFSTGNYRTVMAYSTACTGSCPRRAFFSNPAVNFEARPTGVAETADNHRTGNATGPVVAAFRVSNQIFRSGFDSTP